MTSSTSLWPNWWSTTFTVAVLVLTTAGCADAASTQQIGPAAWSPTPGVATEFTLTCGADGSTSVSDDSVQAQPDGVHLQVVNEYDEPVSVGGFDADPGTTKWTLHEAPGRFELSCWPFSQHGSGDEPPSTTSRSSIRRGCSFLAKWIARARLWVVFLTSPRRPRSTVLRL